MVMCRNGYGPILPWAEMVMGQNDQLPKYAVTSMGFIIKLIHVTVPIELVDLSIF